MLCIYCMASVKCSSCKRTKAAHLFRKNRTRKNGLSSACKSCDQKARTQSRILIAQHIADYLFAHPCVICNEKNILRLQFDHLDPKTKSFEISDAMRKFRKWEPVAEEIKKTQVLCGNCHLEKTAKEQNHWRYRIYRNTLDKLKRKQ